MTKRDKRVLGQANTLYEQVVDFSRVRRERLEKVQREMTARDIGALVLTDIMNIRYCTGVSVMPLWTAVNLAHYTLVPVEGEEEKALRGYQFVTRKPTLVLANVAEADLGNGGAGLQKLSSEVLERAAVSNDLFSDVLLKQQKLPHL